MASLTRYFMEVAYKGTHYSGFQVQENAVSIQYEIEKAFNTIQKSNVIFTGSSRTDTGVHALQNFFHFDYAGTFDPQFLYKLNAILPRDIVVKSLKQVESQQHCRFDAISREYKYYIYNSKNPFLGDRAFYYPYKLDINLLKEVAGILMNYNDFTSFSKRNSQVKTHICTIQKSEWYYEDDLLVYNVKANRFLRGMVKGLTGTMLRVGRGKITPEQFRAVIESKDCTKADFSVPAHGLFLIEVRFT